MPISHTLVYWGFKSFFSKAKERHLGRFLEVSPGFPHLLSGPVTFAHLLCLPHPQRPSFPWSLCMEIGIRSFSFPKEFSLSLFLKIFIYLAAPNLSCGMGDLRLLLQHMVSSSLTKEWTPGSLHWERGVLATGPPGKSPKSSLWQTVSLS